MAILGFRHDEQDYREGNAGRRIRAPFRAKWRE
jgi:hypothetical protein